jgi:2,3-bisphosphoglycerate-dependent phosphoglycerate mutase
MVNPLTIQHSPLTIHHSTLYLVRHAHAEWRPDEERPLSARGAASALKLAEQLALRPIKAIFSSPSARAIQTIAPLAANLRLEPIVVNDLRERELSAETAAAFEAAVAASWRDPGRPAGGGESNDAAQGRGIAIVRRVLAAHPGETAVISTHGSLLALILYGLDPAFGYDFWRSLTFPDVYELTFKAGALTDVRRAWDERA